MSSGKLNLNVSLYCIPTWIGERGYGLGMVIENSMDQYNLNQLIESRPGPRRQISQALPSNLRLYWMRARRGEPRRTPARGGFKALVSSMSRAA